MEDGRKGQTKPFDNRLGAELAQIVMPLMYVVKSEIVEVEEKDNENKI